MAKKSVKALLTIQVSLVPGRCRWCGCIWEDPCANGCAWVERTHTLCSECVPLDKALRTARGRQRLAQLTQETVWA